MYPVLFTKLAYRPIQSSSHNVCLLYVCCINVCNSLTLADKFGDIVDFFGNTTSTSAGALSRQAFVQLFPTTQQSHAFPKSPSTSPVAATGATNDNNVIKFFCWCKSTLYLCESSHLSTTCALEVWWFCYFDMAAPRWSSVAQNVTQIVRQCSPCN